MPGFCLDSGASWGLDAAMWVKPFQSLPRRIFFLAMTGISLATATAGYSFTAVYAFGDSLTDTGRNPAGTGYYMGRYSNGPLWIEYLSAMLGIPYNASNNLAISGSTTSNLLAQIATMPPSTHLSSALCTVWSGPNDFVANEGNGLNSAAWAVTISNMVFNITNAVGTLYTNGAREVIVGNMANLGQTPYLSSYPPSFAAYIDTQVALFNSTLASEVTNLMEGSPGLRVYLMNANQLGVQVYNSPASYGFTVVNIGALDDPSLTNKSFNGPGADYLFWDDIHPTTKMHGYISDQAYSLVGVGLNLTASGTGQSLTISNLYPGFQYSVQGSTNLVTWTNYQTFTASSTNLTIPVSGAPPQAAYFRVGY